MNTNFKSFFNDICQKKDFVLKLSYKDLTKFKIDFYNQKFSEWKLNLIWEYIFDDIDYETMYKIFEKSHLI